MTVPTRSESVPAEWLSATVIDVDTGDVLLSQSGRTPRSVASVAKLILLVELAERLGVEPDMGAALLNRKSVEPVGDSGIWQHLRTDELPAVDVASLVGSLSDNLATNVLLLHVGLASVAARGEVLGLETTRLHDVVRDRRGPDDPPRLGTGSTDELAHLMAELGHTDNEAGARVLEWISHGVDLSMVGQAFGLDPLAHGTVVDRGFEVWSKTGTDIGVRADVGLVRRGPSTIAYAAVANWGASDGDGERDEVLRILHRLGSQIRQMLESDRPGAPLTFGELDP